MAHDSIPYRRHLSSKYITVNEQNKIKYSFVFFFAKMFSLAIPKLWIKFVCGNSIAQTPPKIKSKSVLKLQNKMDVCHAHCS